MSDSTPTRKFNPRSSFQPTGFNPTANFQPGQFAGQEESLDPYRATTPGIASGVAPVAPGLAPGTAAPTAPSAPGSPAASIYGSPHPRLPGSAGLGATSSLASNGAPAVTTAADPAAAAVAGVAPGAPGVAPGGPPTDALEYVSLYHPPLRPLQYHMYAPTPFRRHMAPLAPHERHPDDLFVPEDVRKMLRDRNEATLQVLPASNLPEFVHVYHSLVPLDLGLGKKDEALFGRSVQHYKAVSHTNGRVYMLMRINDYDPSSDNDNALQVINKWKRVSSSAIVGVVEAFTTFAFAELGAHGGTAPGTPGTPGTPFSMGSSSGSASSAPSSAGSSATPSATPGATPNGSHSKELQSLVVVYEWWPLSQHLADLPDPTVSKLWTIAVQLFGAIMAVHRRGLSCRGCINEHFVLLNGSDRVRISSLGVQDILTRGVGDLQPEDFKDLGSMLRRLLKAKSDEEFEEFVTSLEEANVERATQLITPQVFRTADRAYQEDDHLEAVLALELENGRLFRLLAKLEYALQYPEDFSPLSPRYALVLFMEYVFHQQTEKGTPSLNMAHALAALNKLDAGVEDKVLLTSRDKKTRIVLSYAELKHMFSAAFEAKRQA